MRLINYINGVEGVAAGGTAVGNIPVGRRYHGLKAFITATVGGNPSTDPTAIIDYSRLYVNGVVIRDLTPTQTIAIAALMGITAAASELPHYFSDPTCRTLEGEEATSWDMMDRTVAGKCTLEVKFKAGAVAPAMTVLAEFDYARNIVVKDGKPEFFLAIIKQLAQTYNAPQGAYDVTTLPVKFPIQRILLAASAGTITNVEVKRDGEIVQESTTAQNSAFLKDRGFDATQFSFPILFDYTHQLTDALTGVNFGSNPSGIKDLNVKVTSSQANTLTVLTESRANGFV